MTALSPSSDFKARVLSSEIEHSIVSSIARELHVPIATACALRRVFLLERVCGEQVCVEVSGSAHHTRVGDHGADLDTDADGEPVELDTTDEDDETPATKQYGYTSEAVALAVAARLLTPAGEPFRRGRRSQSIHRYMRLTPQGQALADHFIRLEQANKAAKPVLARTPFAVQIRQAKRTGLLNLPRE